MILCFKQCKHKEFQTRTFKCCAGCTLDNPELFTAAIVFSRHHTWSEARWCFEPYVVQFWTGTCHAKLETIFEITRSTRWCCWQTHKYPVRGRSFVICEVVERTGGDNGITGCGTQPRGFAAEYLENQIVHDFVFATSIIHRWLWFCWPCCGARRNTNILVVPSPDIWSVAAWLNCNTESQLAGWLFTNTNVFSQTNTLLSNCVCNCLMPLSLPQSYLVWLPCLWQNLTITPWTNYNGKCFDWLLVGYDMTVKIGPIPCPGWIGKSLLQWLFGNANHGPGRYSASSFVSQQKFSINKIPGLQQQARGLQAMSGSKFFFHLNPNVGKVVHPNDGMTI